MTSASEQLRELGRLERSGWTYDQYRAETALIRTLEQELRTQPLISLPTWVPSFPGAGNDAGLRPSVVLAETGTPSNQEHTT